MSFLDANYHVKTAKILNTLLFDEKLRDVIRKINEMSQETTRPLLIDKGDATRNLNELLSNEFLNDVYSNRDELVRLNRGVEEALRKAGFNNHDISIVTGSLPSDTNYADFKSQFEQNRYFRQYGFPDRHSITLALTDTTLRKNNRICQIPLSVPYLTSLLQACPLVYQSERASLEYHEVLRKFVLLSQRREIKPEDWPHLSKKDIRGLQNVKERTEVNARDVLNASVSNCKTLQEYGDAMVFPNRSVPVSALTNC